MNKLTKTLKKNKEREKKGKRKGKITNPKAHFINKSTFYYSVHVGFFVCFFLFFFFLLFFSAAKDVHPSSYFLLGIFA